MSFTSLHNPVGSINFDATDVNGHAEEEEAAEDERIKNEELKQLLNGAFDDLNIEDDYEQDSSKVTQENDDERRQVWHNLVDSGSENANRANYYNTNYYHDYTKLVSNGYHPQNETARNDCIPGSYAKYVNGTNSIENRVTSHAGSRGDVIGSGANGRSHNHEDQYGVKFLRPSGVPSTVQEESLYQGNDLYFNGGVPSDVAQIQALYSIKCRELDQVRDEFSQFQDIAAKEIRTLKQLLQTERGDKTSLDTRVKELQTVLVSVKEENVKLQASIAGQDTKIKSLETVKTEIGQKLQVAEATIEHLNYQVEELSKSEFMDRTREQNLALVTNMKQKHESELYSLKETIDQQRHDLDSKVSELASLQSKMHEHDLQYQDSLAGKSETIHRLTKNLEQAQNQCCQLLENGGVKSQNDLKAQIHQLENDNSRLAISLSTVKNALTLVKDDLALYDSARRLGVIHTPGPMESTAIGDSTSNRTIGYRTPRSESPLGDSGLGASKDLLTSLKSELERSLTSNRTKRHQILSLHEEISRLKSQLESAVAKAAVGEKTVNEFGAKSISFATSEKQWQEQITKLTDDRAKLSADLVLSKQTTDQLLEREKRLEEQGDMLRRELNEISERAEDEKRAALEKCREVCLELHRNALKENEDLHAQEVVEIEGAYESTFAKLQSAIQSLNKELLDVKEMYLKISDEKKHVEVQLLKFQINHSASRSGPYTKSAETQTETPALTARVVSARCDHNVQTSPVRFADDKRVLLEIRNDVIRDVDGDREKEIGRRVELAKGEWDRLATFTNQLKEEDFKMKMLKVEAEWREKFFAAVKGNSDLNAEAEEKIRVDVQKRVTETLEKEREIYQDHIKDLTDKLEQEKKAALTELSLAKDAQWKVELRNQEECILQERQAELREMEDRWTSEQQRLMEDHKQRLQKALVAMRDAFHEEQKHMEIQKQQDVNRVQATHQRDMAELQGCRHASVELERGLNNALRENAELRRSVEQLQSELHKLTNQRLDYNRQKQRLEDEIASLEHRLSAARQNQYAIPSTPTVSSAELEGLKLRLLSAENLNKEYESRTRSLEKRIDLLTQKKLDYKEKLRKYYAIIQAKDDDLPKIGERVVSGSRQDGGKSGVAQNTEVKAVMESMAKEYINTIQKLKEDVGLHIQTANDRTLRFVQDYMVGSQPPSRQQAFLSRQTAYLTDPVVRKISSDIVRNHYTPVGVSASTETSAFDSPKIELAPRPQGMRSSNYIPSSIASDAGSRPGVYEGYTPRLRNQNYNFQKLQEKHDEIWEEVEHTMNSRPVYEYDKDCAPAANDRA